MDYTQTPTDKLYRHYANCCATAAGALGNSKAQFNEGRAHYIAKELEARGEDVPDHRTAARFGTFNGEGSY